MYGVEENRGLTGTGPTMDLKARFYEVRVDVPSIQEAPQDIQMDPSLHGRWLSNREDLAFTEVTPSLRAAFARAGEVLDGTIPKPSRQGQRGGVGRVIEVRIPPKLAEEIAKIPGVHVSEIQDEGAFRLKRGPLM